CGRAPAVASRCAVEAGANVVRGRRLRAEPGGLPGVGLVAVAAVRVGVRDVAEPGLRPAVAAVRAVSRVRLLAPAQASATGASGRATGRVRTAGSGPACRARQAGATADHPHERDPA